MKHKNKNIISCRTTIKVGVNFIEMESDTCDIFVYPNGFPCRHIKHYCYGVIRDIETDKFKQGYSFENFERCFNDNNNNKMRVLGNFSGALKTTTNSNTIQYRRRMKESHYNVSNARDTRNKIIALIEHYKNEDISNNNNFEIKTNTISEKLFFNSGWIHDWNPIHFSLNIFHSDYSEVIENISKKNFIILSIDEIMNMIISPYNNLRQAIVLLQMKFLKKKKNNIVGCFISPDWTSKEFEKNLRSLRLLHLLFFFLFLFLFLWMCLYFFAFFFISLDLFLLFLFLCIFLGLFLLIFYYLSLDGIQVLMQQLIYV